MISNVMIRNIRLHSNQVGRVVERTSGGSPGFGNSTCHGCDVQLAVLYIQIQLNLYYVHTISKFISILIFLTVSLTSLEITIKFIYFLFRVTYKLKTSLKFNGFI